MASLLAEFSVPLSLSGGRIRPSATQASPRPAMDSALQPRDPPPADSADACIPPDNGTSGNGQQHVQNPDRISSLPDEILIKILSLMTVREAAVTDVLSTRWRHLWESVDHLILDMHTFGMQVPTNSHNHHGNLDFRNSEATKFVRKVNELLSHHKGNKLKEFKVEFPLSSAHASELDRWVAFAVASHVEALTISLCDEHGDVLTDHAEAYVFPLKQLCDAGGCQLHVLSLTDCILETVPANLNGFSYLYSLSLWSVRVVDEVLLSIMSSCNALHNLSLTACFKLINLRASHAQLVNLEVRWCHRLRSISIHAEKMESFLYTGQRADIEFEYVPVLRELSAYVHGMWKHTLALLDKFPNELKMLTFLCSSRLQASRVLQHNGRFAGLKEITWCVEAWKKSIRIVALVLQSAPLVETLNLEVHGNLRPLKMMNIRWPKNFTASSLKTIRIKGFSGEPELVQLLLFLLRRSPVLKTLLIDTHQVIWHGGFGISESEKSKDALRCNYGREVALMFHLLCSSALCDWCANNNKTMVLITSEEG